jgi:hypothetical protein
MKSLHFTVLILLTATCAFSQRPDSAKTTKPIVLLNGIPVTDSVSLNKFDRIDFIQGKKAIDLLGVKAASGIYIISGDGKIPVYGEVVDRKGKKIKNAEVINSHGTVLTLTNDCGSFFLPSLGIDEEVVIRKKRFVEKRFVIQQTHHVITLNKN